MSAASGEPTRRPGFFDSFRAAMTPPPLPDDDGKPLARPWTVLLSVVLAIVAGLALLFVGVASVATVDTGAREAATWVDDRLAECQDRVGGRGEAVVVPENPNQEQQAWVDFCRDQQPWGDEDYSNYKTTNTILGISFGVFGLLSIVGAVLMLREKIVGRRMVIAAAVVLVASTLLLGLQSLPLLVATLFLFASVALTLIGPGSRYFQVLRRRARS
ncbi:hypothetical protein [Nakamurella leprariae]|uniref:Uncharacterized protein n=1 Tax=Nakamurella leprariae TaxID=2803911 RepID=A0A938YD64_9ACTN|nr:hypothetical protein [Nakamurella leprariae]MBM9466282.1 hypothetical protein [Nakamurella leprariae]